MNKIKIADNIKAIHAIVCINYSYFAPESFERVNFINEKKKSLILSKCQRFMIHFVLYLNIKKVYAFIHREICVNFKLLFTKS